MSVCHGAWHGGAALSGRPCAPLPPRQEGIEAIHLFTGRTICKLHLPKDGLHADVNGDGVLDHAMAYGGNPQRNAHSDTGHRPSACPCLIAPQPHGRVAIADTGGRRCWVRLQVTSTYPTAG